MEAFRKIGIGNDMKTAMYYVVGSRAMKDYVVSDIILEEDDFKIYIKKDAEKQIWKSFSKQVVTFKEYKLQ